MTGTAWTVFEGTKPEPMDVEILGILRGARGPGQDLILARLHGAKAEFTGVVDGMSGSPVYLDGKLAGSLSYRIGQFAKEPIAGITPIEQMLEVRDLPAADPSAIEMQSAEASSPAEPRAAGAESTRGPIEGESRTVQPMETPLSMSGFRPEAIRFWQEQTAGTTMGLVAAGGSLGGGSSLGSPAAESAAAGPALEPGSAVSMQLIRGDLEVAATCTVTWVDAKQLLACGHPVLGAGPVSMPMTRAEVVTTLASPLDAFKIVNTGATVGAFTEDRESAIRGALGARARMIPVHIAVDDPEGARKVNVEILDLPSLTPLAAQVVLYDSLLETNEGSAALSYHLTGSIDVAGFAAVPVDVWAPAGDAGNAAMQAALIAGNQFTRLYSNGARQGAIRAIDLHIQAIPRRMQVALDSARLVSGDIVHAGDTIEVEATVRNWHEPERNVRIAVKLPARLGAGNLRLLVSDAATLDRTLHPPRLAGQPADLAAVLARGAKPAPGRPHLREPFGAGDAGRACAARR